jgi:hypothetical protein
LLCLNVEHQNHAHDVRHDGTHTPCRLAGREAGPGASAPPPLVSAAQGAERLPPEYQGEQ